VDAAVEQMQNAGMFDHKFQSREDMGPNEEIWPTTWLACMTNDEAAVEDD
jgi:hypothetical protein